jgi:phosphatidylinositol 4-kinase A
MYSLLNYIAATGMDLYESSQTNSPYGNHSSGRATPAVQVAENGLKSMSDDEKRLVGISTIAVVSKLALEFKTDEVRLIEIMIA